MEWGKWYVVITLNIEYFGQVSSCVKKKAPPSARKKKSWHEEELEKTRSKNLNRFSSNRYSWEYLLPLKG